MNSIIQLRFSSPSSSSSSSLLPLNSHHHQKCLVLIRHNKKQRPFPAAMTRRRVQQSQHCAASTRQVMAKALPHSSLVLIAASSSSSPKPIDMPLFLQTSALLLFLYFTANFVVPELISKYFGFDKVKEEKNVNDGDMKNGITRTGIHRLLSIYVILGGKSMLRLVLLGKFSGLFLYGNHLIIKF